MAGEQTGDRQQLAHTPLTEPSRLPTGVANTDRLVTAGDTAPSRALHPRP